MGPAQGAVPGVHPEFFHFALADVGNVGRRGRAQAGPELRVAALGFQPCVADAGEHGFHSAGQHVAAGAGQAAVQPGVVAADFDGAGDAQGVAQSAHGAFDRVVDKADLGRQFGLQDFEGGAIALAGIDRQVHAHRAQQRRGVRAHGQHKLVAVQGADLAAGAVLHADRVECVTPLVE